jgi:hypothetical protein
MSALENLFIDDAFTEITAKGYERRIITHVSEFKKVLKNSVNI